MRIGIFYTVIAVALLMAARRRLLRRNNSTSDWQRRRRAQRRCLPSAPKVQPPPALPGAAPTGVGAAPADRPALDIEPNEALFDSINRGDIAGARDAINRGADLAARNVLGMTPMELSVDLGRNNISFMLLSMRGGDSGAPRRPPAAATAATAGKPTPTRQAKQIPVHPAPVTQARATASAQAAPAQTARLYSGDGGAPMPSAGFLGFDSGRR